MIQHAHAWKIHIITVSPLPQCFMARGEVLLRILGEHPTFGGDAPHRQVWTPWQHEGSCQRWTSDRGQQEKWPRCSFSSSNDAEHSRTSNIGTLCSIEHRNELNILTPFFVGVHLGRGFAMVPAALGSTSDSALSAYLPKPSFAGALAKRRCDGWRRGWKPHILRGNILGVRHSSTQNDHIPHPLGEVFGGFNMIQLNSIIFQCIQSFQ